MIHHNRNQFIPNKNILVTHGFEACSVFLVDDPMKILIIFCKIKWGVLLTALKSADINYLHFLWNVNKV